MNRILTLTALFSLFLAHSSFSQGINTYSPYSRYGLGDLRERAYTQNRAMGGIAQGVYNPYAINNLNPATYVAQDSMSFILDFGFEASGTYYNLGNQSLYNPTANFHHIAVQFPLTKWWGASLGIQPYSDLGYKLRFVETDPYLLAHIGAIKYYHYGEGGLSQAYIGNAFKTIKNLSVGFNLSYFFGSLDYHSDVLFPSGSSYNNVYRVNSVSIRSVAYSFGAQYKLDLGAEKENKLVLGFTLDNQSSLAAERVLHASTYSGMFDTIQYIHSKNKSIDMPSNFSGGFTYTYKKRLTVGADYSYQDWTNARFFENTDSLTASKTLRIGVEYTPNPNDLKNYLKRISYRVGLYQSQTYLKLGSENIVDNGITFGIGLPLRRTNTSFNISGGFGTRGVNKNGLIKENYGFVGVGITFYDVWFVKRKYN